MTTTPLTGQDLIDLFNQDTGDTTELSDDASLALAEKWYRFVLADRDWNFLKKEATGTASVSAAGVITIPLPSDFKKLTVNGQATDIAVGVSNSRGWQEGNAAPMVVYMAVTTGVNDVFQAINWSARRQYTGKSGYFYIDQANNQIVLTGTPHLGDVSYSFDYIYSPTPLTLESSPVFHADYHHVIHHGMATDDMIFQLFDRAKSYEKENQAQFTSYLTQLRYWDVGFNFD